MRESWFQRPHFGRTSQEVGPLAVDAHDVIAWRLNESAPVWKNTGSGGALDLLPRTAAITPPTAVAIAADPAGTGYAMRVYGGQGLNNSASTSPGDGTGTAIGEIASGLTISLYAFLIDYQSSAFGCLVEKTTIVAPPQPLTTGYDIAIQFNYNATNDGQWYTGLRAGGTAQFPIATPPLPLGQWVHVGFTYDGTNVRQYLNGSLTDTQPTSPAGAIDYVLHGPWDVGGTWVGNSCINGYLQDIRIANVARDLAWFASMAAALSTSAPPTGFAAPHFDPVIGTSRR